MLLLIPIESFQDIVVLPHGGKLLSVGEIATEVAILLVLFPRANEFAAVRTNI